MLLFVGSIRKSVREGLQLQEMQQEYDLQRLSWQAVIQPCSFGIALESHFLCGRSIECFVSDGYLPKFGSRNDKCELYQVCPRMPAQGAPRPDFHTGDISSTLQ